MIAIYLGRDWLDTGTLRKPSSNAVFHCRLCAIVTVETGRATYPITLAQQFACTFDLRHHLGNANVQLSRLASEIFSADTICIVSKRQ
jgi:hypothetical protein